MCRDNPSTNVVLYARVSSKDQEREGFSIPAQQKLLRQYAAEQHLTIVREFLDVETAKQAGRGGFGEMLAFLKATPTCRSILVEKTDRLYRNIKDWITVDDLEVVVHFVKENAIVSKASRSSDKFMHGMKVLMAKNYVDNLSEEVKKGLREKAEQGHWPTVAPVGYLNNRETHRIDVDPVRGPLVTALFELYGSGTHSLLTLRHKARTLGLTHWRRDRPLTKSELHRLLQNPIYTGEFQWQGQRHQGSHTPLITRATFARVQAVLAGKGKGKGRYVKRRHPFMGLLTCGRCGCAMTAELKKGRYVYYHCTGFKGRCGNTYIRQETLSTLLGTTVHAIQLPADVADNLAASLRQADDQLECDRGQARQHLEQRRRALLGKLDRAYDDFASGRIAEDFWARRTHEWEEERRSVEDELGRLAEGNGRLTVTGEKILELAKQAAFL